MTAFRIFISLRNYEALVLLQQNVDSKTVSHMICIAFKCVVTVFWRCNITSVLNLRGY